MNPNYTQEEVSEAETKLAEWTEKLNEAQKHVDLWETEVCIRRHHSALENVNY